MALDIALIMSLGPWESPSAWVTAPCIVHPVLSLHLRWQYTCHHLQIDRHLTAARMSHKAFPLCSAPGPFRVLAVINCAAVRMSSGDTRTCLCGLEGWRCVFSFRRCCQVFQSACACYTHQQCVRSPFTHLVSTPVFPVVCSHLVCVLWYSTRVVICISLMLSVIFFF